MLVFVKIINGSEYSYQVTPDTTVKDLKDLIATELKVASSNIRLTLKGKPLLDGSTLKDHSIEDGCKIHMVIKKDTESELSKQLKSVAKNYVTDVDQFAIVFNKELKNLANEMSLDDIERYDELREKLSK